MWNTHARTRVICEYLDAFAPSTLAEEWDNVGLLAGDPAADVARVMTCLTITPDSCARGRGAAPDLIVSHHPLPFRPLQRVVTDTTVGRLLWQLITHQIAIYSPHTAFDSAVQGINQRLAEGMGLVDIVPLLPVAGAPEGTGSGRLGGVPQPATLRDVAARLKQFLSLEHLHYVGPLACADRTGGGGLWRRGRVPPAGSRGRLRSARPGRDQLAHMSGGGGHRDRAVAARSFRE